MIVCVCKRVSDRELEAAMADGAKNVKQLSRRTGCGTQCGRCVPTVREMLQDNAAQRQVERSPFPSLPLANLAGI